MKESYLNDKNINKKYSAKKSLNNYINQLELHFELDEEEVISILSAIVKNRKSSSSKKWWHIFRI